MLPAGKAAVLECLLESPGYGQGHVPDAAKAQGQQLGTQLLQEKAVLLQLHWRGMSLCKGAAMLLRWPCGPQANDRQISQPATETLTPLSCPGPEFSSSSSCGAHAAAATVGMRG